MHGEKFPVGRRKWGVAMLFAFGLFGGMFSDQLQAAERKTVVQLEDYLKGLGYAPIPFRRSEHNEFLLQGELGGKSRTFLLDSGWGVTTLDEKSAHGLKTLGELGVEVSDSLFGKLTNSSIVLVEKFALGQAQFLNQPVLVQKLEMESYHVRFDAILGIDFCVRNFCLLDCGGRRLYVRGAKRPIEVSKALEDSLHLSGFVAVPMQVNTGLVVSCEINAHPVTLLVDTGSQWSFLDDSLVKSLGLSAIKFADPPVGSLIQREAEGLYAGMGKVGVHKLNVTTAKTFRISDRTWKNSYFGIVDLKHWGFAKRGQPAEGVQGFLGADFLVNNGALIDFSDGKAWFRAEKP